MADEFSDFRKALASPADNFLAITPDDGADLATVPRALFIGVAGDVVLRGSDGVDVTFTVVGSQIIPVRPIRVLATGTTATGIIGLS